MIYTLMRFPRAASCMFISVKHDIGLDMLPSYQLDSSTGFYLVDADLMERLVTLSNNVATDKKVYICWIKFQIPVLKQYSGLCNLKNLLVLFVCLYLNNQKQVSVVQCRAAAVYWNILVKIAHFTANAKIIDDKSYMVSFLILAFGSTFSFLLIEIIICLQHSITSTSAHAQDIR